MPALPDTFVNGNYLTSTGITAFQNFMNAYKATVTDQGITYTPAIFSPKTHAFNVIGSMNVDQRVYTDRRRTSRI